MDIMDMLRSSGGIDALANQLGVPPATATAGAEALLPAILGGFSKRSEAAGGGEAGLGGLIGMLGGLGGLASILDFNRDGNPLDDIIGMAGKFAR